MVLHLLRGCSFRTHEQFKALGTMTSWGPVAVEHVCFLAHVTTVWWHSPSKRRAEPPERQIIGEHCLLLCANQRFSEDPHVSHNKATPRSPVWASFIMYITTHVTMLDRKGIALRAQIELLQLLAGSPFSAKWAKWLA